MLELIVFGSGALVMIMEMTGSRVLAPHLGTSLIVWTSLIGVVLACMAAGAYLGGRLADKGCSRKVLAVILAITGICIGLAGFTHHWIVALAAQIISLHVATLVAALLLLGVPALLFGMVTPYVIRLSLDDLKTSGSTVGRLYALSTAGSILGTFLGGFGLISWFGSSQILLGSGAVMLGLSILAYSAKPGLRGMLSIVLLTGAVFSAVYLTPRLASGEPALIETPYNTLILSQGIKDRRQILLLSTDPGKAQSGIFLDNPQELALSYTHFFKLSSALVPEAKSVLMLGGGGYSVPRWLLTQSNLPLTTVDVVELDPGMTAVTAKHFTLPNDKRLNIIHEDARRFLNTNVQAYDLVFVDVFGSYYSIPFHVATQEAIHKMRQATAQHGALIMNVIASINGDTGRIFRAIHQGLLQEFAEVHIYGVRDPNPTEVQNLMLVALPQVNPHVDLTAIIPNVAGEAKTIPHMLARRINSPIAQDVAVLTDSYAPVERYMLPLIER